MYYCRGNNVVTHASRRNNPLLNIESRDPADRKTVTPMHIRHGHRGPHNTRQAGHIFNLFYTFVSAENIEEFLVEKDHSVDTHGTMFFDHIPVVIKFY